MAGDGGTCAPAARCNCGKRLDTRHLKKSPACQAFYEIEDKVMADECGPCDTDEDPDETPQLSEISARAADEVLRSRVARDLASLRFERGLGDADIKVIKEMVLDWVQLSAESTSHLVSPFLKEGAAEDVKGFLAQNPFDGLHTVKQELAHAARNVPILEERVVNITKSDIVVTFDLVHLLERHLQHDARFLQQHLARSDEYKMGNKWKKNPEKLDDFTDGIAARWHPHLLRPATAEEVDDLRVPLIVNCDDIEVSEQCAPDTPFCPLTDVLPSFVIAALQRARRRAREAQALRHPSRVLVPGS
jgi:hypothetical protein